MKPIFRNDPNMPLDINTGTVSTVVTTLDATGEGTVAGMLSTSVILAAYSAEVADTFVDESADLTAGDGIVTSSTLASADMVVVFSN